MNKERETRRAPALLAAALVLLLLVACAAPTPTATPTPTLTPTPTSTPTPTPSPTPGAVATPVPFLPPKPLTIPSPTPTPAPAADPTASPAPTPIPQPTATSTPQPTWTREPAYTTGGRIVTFGHTQGDIVHLNVLRDLARTAPMAFDAFMDWLGDGQQPGRSTKLLLDDYVRLANADEPAAIRLIRMPFLEEVGPLDRSAVRLLREVASTDKGMLDWMLAHPILRGGITDANVWNVFLVRLERTRPVHSDAIRSLHWVQDGVASEGWEDDAVYALVEMASRRPRTFEALLERTWLRDGITSEEWSVLTAFAQTPPANDAEVALLAGMPFLDAVDRTDARLIRVLFEPLPHSPGVVGGIVAQPEVRGGITDAQRAMVAIWVLGLYDLEDAARFSVTPWLWDGLQDAEARAFWVLWDTARLEDAQDVFGRLLQEPWIRDGITSTDAAVLHELMRVYHASGDGPGEVVRILAMPFLDTIEEADIDTLRSLAP